MKHLGILCVSTTVEDAAAKFAAATSGSLGGISMSGYGISYKKGKETGEAQFALVGGDALIQPFSPVSGRKTLKSVMGMSVSSALEGHVDLPDTIKSESDATAAPMAFVQQCKCGTVSVSTNASLLQHCVACANALPMEKEGEIKLVATSGDDDDEDADIGDSSTVVDEEDDTSLIDDDLSDGADITDAELTVTQEDIDALSDDERGALAADLAEALGENAGDIDLTDITLLDDNQRQQLSILFYDDLDGEGDDDGDGDDTSESRQDGPEGVAHDPAEVVSDIPFFRKKEQEKVAEAGDGCDCEVGKPHSESCDLPVSNSAGDGYATLCKDVQEIIGDQADCKHEAGEVYVPEKLRDTVLDGLVAHGWKLDHEALYKDGAKVQITEAVDHRMRLSTATQSDSSESPEGSEANPLTEDTNMLGQPEEALVDDVSVSKDGKKTKAKAKVDAKMPFPSESAKKKDDDEELEEDDDETVKETTEGDDGEEEEDIDVKDMLSVSSMQTLDQAATPMTSAVALARTHTSVSAEQPKWVLMVDGFPVAACSDLSAHKANPDVAQMIDQPENFEAVALAAMEEQGIAAGSAAVGFEAFELNLPVKTVVENALATASAAMSDRFDTALSAVQDQFKDAVSMSFMGMNTDFFPEAMHPLKGALFDRMHSIAVSCGLQEQQAASMVQTAISESFADAGPNFGQQLVMHAMDLMGMHEQARACIQSNIVAHARAQGQTVTANLGSGS